MLSLTHSQALPSCLANNSVSGLQILNRVNLNLQARDLQDCLVTVTNYVYENTTPKEFLVTSIGNLYKKPHFPQSLVTIKTEHFYSQLFNC